MKKNNLFRIIIFLSLLLQLSQFCYAQNEQANLKYWYYRERLKYFVIPGTKRGESEIASTRNRIDQGDTNHLNIDFGQHGVIFGYYLSVLATEFNILYVNGKYSDADNDKQEIELALDQFDNYMDNCESYWNIYGGTYPDLLNGFFIRDAVPRAFLDTTDIYGITVDNKRHYDILNEDLKSENRWIPSTTSFNKLPLGHPAFLECDTSELEGLPHYYKVEEGTEGLTGASMSQDEGLGVLMGLALIYQCVNDADVKNHARTIAYRIIRKISDIDNIESPCDWIINDPRGPGHPVPQGCSSRIYAYAFAAAASRFFGFDEHQFFCNNIIEEYNAEYAWQLLQLSTPTSEVNGWMQSTLGAIGDSWYVLVWNIWLQRFVWDRSITSTDMAIWENARSWGWTQFYHLLYRALHPDWSINDSDLNSALDDLNSAPCEGPYNYGGKIIIYDTIGYNWVCDTITVGGHPVPVNCHYEPIIQPRSICNNCGVANWCFTYRWHGTLDEQMGGSNSRGNFFGCDFMLEYNLYEMALHGRDNTTIPNYHQYRNLILSGTWPRKVDGHVVGSTINPKTVVAFKTINSTEKILVYKKETLSLVGDVSYTTQKSIKFNPGFAVANGAIFKTKLQDQIFCEEFSGMDGLESPDGMRTFYDFPLIMNKLEDDDSVKSIEVNETICKIFPNPVKNQLTILFNSGLGNQISYYLYDLQSCLKISGQSDNISTDVDLSSVQSGIYVLKVRSPQTISTFKIIKE